MLLHRLLRGLGWIVLCVLLGAIPGRAHEDRDDTLRRLDETIAATPSDPELWRSRAVLERRSAHFSQAHADLTKAVELGLGLAFAQRERGLIWLEEGRFADAETSLRSARQQSPGDLPTLLAHARALAGLERWREAADAYAALIGVAPHSSPDVHLERIRACEAIGGAAASDEALRAADAALAVLGAVPAIEQAALDVELRAGRTDAALARLDRMANGVGRENLQLQRAEILERAGREEAARVAYADALAALAARSDSRRATPAAKQLESQARDAIARLARRDGK